MQENDLFLGVVLLRCCLPTGYEDLLYPIVCLTNLSGTASPLGKIDELLRIEILFGFHMSVDNHYP